MLLYPVSVVSLQSNALLFVKSLRWSCRKTRCTVSPKMSGESNHEVMLLVTLTLVHYSFQTAPEVNPQRQQSMSENNEGSMNESSRSPWGEWTRASLQNSLRINWTKPSVTTRPDHYKGIRGVCCFIWAITCIFFEKGIVSVSQCNGNATEWLERNGLKAQTAPL